MNKLLMILFSLFLFLPFSSSVFAQEDIITGSVYRQSMYYRDSSNNSGRDTAIVSGGNPIVVPGAGNYSSNLPVFFVFGIKDYKFNDGESYQVKVSIPVISANEDYDYTWKYNSTCQLEELGTGATMPVSCSIEDDKKTLVFSFRSIYQINDSSLWVFRYGDWTNDSDVIINNMSANISSASVNPSYKLIYNEKIDLDILEDQNQTIIDQNNATNDKLDDLNDSINNSDSSGASDSAGGFFEDFTTDTFGLTAVITAPLNFIKSLTSSSCTPLNIPLPFVDTNLTLPCMSTIYNQYFGGFYTLYQTITTGLIAYWVCVRIFNLVKDFKNPDHDEIEVMDL